MAGRLPECVGGSASTCWRGVAAVLAALLLASGSSVAFAQAVLPPGLGTPGGGTRVPRQGYDVVLAALAEGNVATGLDVAAKENRGGIRAGAQRWIDSIATAAMLGECLYELGRYTEAVAAYDEALLLSAEHGDWLLSVRFSSQPLKPMPRAIDTPWAQSNRNVPAGQFPSTATIRQGTTDTKEVLEKGGVLAAPVDYPIRPQAIIKSTVLALYRRHSILGDLSDVGPVLENAKRALSARPAPPNHYSQSWIDIALGTANWAQGRVDQAVPMLKRGLVAENQFDHPLTCWGLIVLGRIALASDDAASASAFFSEATISATQFQDIRALEEAFRWAVTAHLASGGQGVPAGIPLAVEWAGRKLPALQARLLVMQAEMYAASGDTRRALASLRDIDPRVLRGDLGQGWVGAQASYAEALAAYADGRVAKGDTELQRAVELVRSHCPRLLQISRTMGIVGEGSSLLSDRQADLLFEKLLGDPTASDYAIDPLGTLAFLATPKPNAYATWFSVAARRSDEEALAAAEAGRRGRWLSTQFLGGRQLAIRRLLELDPAILPADDAPRRAALLARSPELARLLDETVQARAPLSAAMGGVVGAAAGGEAALPGDTADWQAYARLSQLQAQAIASISAGRDDTPLAFPPLYDVQEIRTRLRPGMLVLSFHQTPGGLAGTLEGHERLTTWQVTDLAGLQKSVTDLMRGMAVYDFNNVVGTDRFAETSWQEAASRLERVLFANARVDLSRDIEELVIVPDGLLWYVPFDLLPVGSNVAAGGELRLTSGDDEHADARPLLRDVCRVRYAPTRSLAVEMGPPLRREGVVGVHAGHLYRGDKPEVVAAAAAEITAAMEKAVAFPAGQVRESVPLPLPASLVDALVVLDELPPTATASGAAMIPGEGSRRGMSFDEWLAPPRKRPGLVVLAGFQSAAASVNTPNKLPPNPGDELFEASMAALAAGARTALISRWRTGGYTTAEFTREFVRDCLGPGEDAGGPAESWRRAVDLVSPEPLHLPYEPRVKLVGNTVLEDASHPFFWAGYMLIDTGSEPEAADAGGIPVMPRPAARMQAGNDAGGAMPAVNAAQPAAAAGPTQPRAPVNQAFNPLLDNPTEGSRE